MVNINITPDQIILFEIGPLIFNATIVNTWIVMAVLIGLSLAVGRKMREDPNISPLQNFLETLVDGIRNQIKEMMDRDPDPFLPFLGTLFLYIFLSNILSIVPYYESPTGSITTTAALAIIVFFAVPVFGIAEKGVAGYFSHYVKPSPVMLPFNIISELSRTLALAVRLFGNVMSGGMIVGVLLSIAPLFIPVIMQALGLLIGAIQAYIFATLATIYIASAVRVQDQEQQKSKDETRERTESTEEEIHG